MDQYETVERLGMGACGAVYLVRHIHTKRVFALKKIEIDNRQKTRTQQAILKEASILSGLKHPHIVAFHSSFIHEDGQHVCIMQDYCDGGTLSDKIQEAASKNSPLPEQQIMQWFIQILMAVQYIHSRKVLHRDLKTENVFLTKNSMVKIGDFGISKILDSTIDVAKTVLGTPSYFSPELCQDIPYNSKSDIWALGCILYELCALHPPFDGNNLINLIFKIVKADYEPIPTGYSEGVHDIVNKLLVKTPEDRPSCSAILNLPYVKEHLSSFIALTETLRKQCSNNSSMQDKKSPNAGCSLASPRASRSRTGEATPRLKCSPLANELRPPQQSELKAESPKPALNVCDEATKGRNQAEEGDNNSDYSDDFDECSDSEIEEDLYHNVLDTEEEGPSESELYPARNRARSPGRRGDDLSLDRKQRDVRYAMQAAHNMPMEDTMLKLSSNRPASSSIPGPSSGRGSMKKDIAMDKAVGGSGTTSENDDTQYADDFEDYDSAEELEEMLLQAREAQGLDPHDDYFEDGHHYRDYRDDHDDDKDNDGDDNIDDDEMAHTLTENSFIKSQLIHVRERGQPCSSGSGHTVRGVKDSTDKTDTSWKFHTFPNS